MHGLGHVRIGRIGSRPGGLFGSASLRAQSDRRHGLACLSWGEKRVAPGRENGDVKAVSCGKIRCEVKVLPRGAADVIGGNEISTEGIGHGRPHRLAGLDPCGTEICDNLVDARPSYQLGSVRIWNLQWGGGPHLRWGEVAPDVMVPPWCHGVGGVWGRHGEVAVVFLLQIAVGATWGGSGAPGKQVFHGSGHVARGQLGICRGDCGVVKRRAVRGRHFQPAAGPHPCGLGSGPHQGWSAVAGRTSPL